MSLIGRLIKVLAVRKKRKRHSSVLKRVIGRGSVAEEAHKKIPSNCLKQEKRGYIVIERDDPRVVRRIHREVAAATRIVQPPLSKKYLKIDSEIEPLGHKKRIEIGSIVQPPWYNKATGSGPLVQPPGHKKRIGTDSVVQPSRHKKKRKGKRK